MSAKYLIRLDDACPTMDHGKWDAIEAILNENLIKPIVAVIPNNLDPSMEISSKDENFWEKVRRWQSNGWAIAVHGETHAMQTTCEDLIFPYYLRSEFAGLSREDKKAKIKRAYDTFIINGVKPDLWVSPAHCIDEETVTIIKSQTPINCFSDGIAFESYSAFGVSWIPQQLWTYKWRPFGLWTICLHPNQMSIADIKYFERKVIKTITMNAAEVTKVIAKTTRKLNYFERFYAMLFWIRRGKFCFAFNMIFKRQ